MLTVSLGVPLMLATGSLRMAWRLRSEAHATHERSGRDITG